MKKIAIITLAFVLSSQLLAQSSIQPTKLYAGGAEPFWGLNMTATDNSSYQAVFTQAAESPNDKIKSHLILKDHSPVSGAVFYYGMTENNKVFSVITAKIACLEDGTGKKSPLSIFVILDNQRIYQGCGSSNLDVVK